jgi:hypothetical protein
MIAAGALGECEQVLGRRRRRGGKKINVYVYVYIWVLINST